MTHIYVRHNSHIWHVSCMPQLHEDDSSQKSQHTRVTWLIYMCDMTQMCDMSLVCLICMRAGVAAVHEAVGNQRQEAWTGQILQKSALLPFYVVNLVVIWRFRIFDSLYRSGCRVLAPYIYTYTRTHIHTYTHTHIHTYTHTHIHTYTHTYIHKYIHTYIHIHTYTHTHIHTYTHTNLHTYTQTHIHTNTHTCILCGTGVNVGCGPPEGLFQKFPISQLCSHFT